MNDAKSVCLHFANIHQCQPDGSKLYRLDLHDDTVLWTLQWHQIPKIFVIIFLIVTIDIYGSLAYFLIILTIIQLYAYYFNKIFIQ